MMTIQSYPLAMNYQILHQSVVRCARLLPLATVSRNALNLLLVLYLHISKGSAAGRAVFFLGDLPLMPTVLPKATLLTELY